MYIISRNNYLQQKKIELVYLHYKVSKKIFPLTLNSFFPTFSSQLKIFYRFFPTSKKKKPPDSGFSSLCYLTFFKLNINQKGPN